MKFMRVIRGECKWFGQSTMVFKNSFNDNKFASLRWRHNGHDCVSNHQPRHCLLNRLFERRKKTSKLRVTGLCAGNSPGTGEFPAQMASNAENVSIWWRHQDEWNKTFNINTVTSRKHHDVSNHRQLDFLFNTLMLITTKKTPQLRITGPLWRESTGYRWIPLTKGQ